jgi:hypothetical protein
MSSNLYSNIFYKKYALNVFSQNGEDGIIEELLRRLCITNGWVCEFGAWDGVHLSNTFNLIKNKGFKGVFIEGDPVKFKDLLVTCETHANIHPVCNFVDYEEESTNSLDNILKNTDIPNDFDVLSIDIDSYDYQVWKSFKHYSPKIVVIEINSSVDPNNETHIHNPGVYNSTGFLPMYKLAVEKGYTFVLHTGNMIFVRNDLYKMLNLEYTNPLENFRTCWRS